MDSKNIQYIDLNIILEEEDLGDLVGFVKHHELTIKEKRRLIKNYNDNLVDNGRHFEDDLVLTNYLVTRLLEEKYVKTSITDTDYKLRDNFLHTN